MASGRLPRPKGLLLAPGAGATSNHSLLVALERELQAEDIKVLRLDFPYVLAGRRVPDRPPVLVRAVESGAAELAGRLGAEPSELAFGGRSMGGRICSIAVAGGLPACGLVLVSYPLHPPGRPERLRTDHFSSISMPCLFVSGDRDPFGTPDELADAIRAIPAPVSHVVVARGDHGLRRRDDEVVEIVKGWIAASYR